MNTEMSLTVSPSPRRTVAVRLDASAYASRASWAVREASWYAAMASWAAGSTTGGDVDVIHRYAVHIADVADHALDLVEAAGLGVSDTGPGGELDGPPSATANGSYFNSVAHTLPPTCLMIALAVSSLISERRGT